MMPAIVWAQKPKNPDTYASGITAENLKQHLYIVAGDEMEGRGTGTEGERKAAAYIENHFRSLNMKPGNKDSFLFPFPVVKDEMVGSSIAVNNQQFEPFVDFNAGLGAYSSTMLFSETIYLGKYLPDSSVQMFMRDKVILVDGDEAMMHGYNQGVAAILVIRKELPMKVPTRQEMVMLNRHQPFLSPNVFYVSENVAKAIMGAKTDSLRAAGAVKGFKPVICQANITLDVKTKVSHTNSYNVMGLVEGTDKKNEYLYITAHYDHLGKHGGKIYYGADDDGSGTVGILALASAFAKAKAEGNGPRRTIVFMTVSGEEKGLWGSSYYCEHPVFPHDKASVDLNIDMIGRIDPDFDKPDTMNYIYTIGDNKLSTDLAKITDQVNKKYTKLTIDRRFNDPNDPNSFYTRSDHYNFARKGIPVIFYFNGTHADYHKSTDTPDKIYYDLMAKRVKLIFHTAWEIANRNEMLKRDIPLNAK